MMTETKMSSTQCSEREYEQEKEIVELKIQLEQAHFEINKLEAIIKQEKEIIEHKDEIINKLESENQRFKDKYEPEHIEDMVNEIPDIDDNTRELIKEVAFEAEHIKYRIDGQYNLEDLYEEHQALFDKFFKGYSKRLCQRTLVTMFLEKYMKSLYPNLSITDKSGDKWGKVTFENKGIIYLLIYSDKKGQKFVKIGRTGYRREINRITKYYKPIFLNFFFTSNIVEAEKYMKTLIQNNNIPFLISENGKISESISIEYLFDVWNIFMSIKTGRIETDIRKGNNIKHLSFNVLMFTNKALYETNIKTFLSDALTYINIDNIDDINIKFERKYKNPPIYTHAEGIELKTD